MQTAGVYIAADTVIHTALSPEPSQHKLIIVFKILLPDYVRFGLFEVKNVDLDIINHNQDLVICGESSEM